MYRLMIYPVVSSRSEINVLVVQANSTVYLHAWRDQLDPDNIPNDEPHAKYILDLFLGEIQKQCDQLTEV